MHLKRLPLLACICTQAKLPIWSLDIAALVSHTYPNLLNPCTQEMQQLS